MFVLNIWYRFLYLLCSKSAWQPKRRPTWQPSIDPSRCANSRLFATARSNRTCRMFSWNTKTSKRFVNCTQLVLWKVMKITKDKPYNARFVLQYNNASDQWWLHSWIYPYHKFKWSQMHLLLLKPTTFKLDMQRDKRQCHKEIRQLLWKITVHRKYRTSFKNYLRNLTSNHVLLGCAVMKCQKSSSPINTRVFESLYHFCQYEQKWL